MFGKLKCESGELLTKWSKDNNTPFTGLVIPNVFGPFGNPYYNSVAAIFKDQLTRNEEPKIELDAHLKLIYIGELVELIWKAI